jgi:hypothetical protein
MTSSLMMTSVSFVLEMVETNGSSDLPGGFCLWLASSEADFLKGRFLWAHWDVDELISKKDVIQGGNLLTFQLNGWPNGIQD